MSGSTKSRLHASQIPREFILSRSEFLSQAKGWTLVTPDSVLAEAAVCVPVYRSQNFRLFLPHVCCPSGLAQDSGRRDGGAGPVGKRTTSAAPTQKMLERIVP